VAVAEVQYLPEEAEVRRPVAQLLHPQSPVVEVVAVVTQKPGTDRVRRQAMDRRDVGEEEVSVGQP
jgi:hypothetical protein